MKKLLVYLIVLIASTFMMPADALTIVEKDMGYVSVSTNSTKEVVPDTASVTFTVETTANDAKQVVKQNNNISDNLINAVKEIIAGDSSDSIQTKNFILRPNYRYDKNEKRTFLNYTALNSITVKTKKMELVPRIIDVAINNNATSVSDLDFYVENEKEFCGDLAREALNKAKIIANLTAADLGQKVKGIKSGKVDVYPQSRYGTQFASFKSADLVSGNKMTPIEFGKVKLQANVDAEFYVK